LGSEGVCAVNAAAGVGCTSSTVWFHDMERHFIDVAR
jgi:hypothetical protein